MYIPGQMRYEPARALNLDEVELRFRQLVGDDAALRNVDGVLIKAWVEANGTVRRARGVKPYIAGVIPRLLPWIFNEDGVRLRRLRWVKDERLLRLAGQAAAGLRFDPARLNGSYVATTALTGLRLDPAIRLVVSQH